MNLEGTKMAHLLSFKCTTERWEGVLHFDAKFRISWDVGWSIHMASLH